MIINLILVGLSIAFTGCGINNGSKITDEIKKESSSNPIVIVNEINEEADGDDDMRTTLFLANTKRDNCMLEPILQNPTVNTVTVSWFTDYETAENEIYLYENASSVEPSRIIKADTMKMSRLRGGKTQETCNDPLIDGNIYRHTVVVTDIPENHGNDEDRIIYRVRSGEEYSNVYKLAAMPCDGCPMKILLTSDLQIKKMCSVNIEKAYETIGQFDAVLVDGDIVDVADRVYDWFYADNAFFRVMTGTARDTVEGKVYSGAPILQETPIFTAIGNHDVMGVLDDSRDLSVQFNYPSTREIAKKKWDALGLNGDESKYIEDNSFNTITYEEMFDFPQSSSGNDRYYAVTIGDIRLIVLEMARIWRLANLGAVGKYSEIPGSQDINDYYGAGDFIFEPIKEGSEQLEFLKRELESSEYKNAKYRMVMFHMGAHSLGCNEIPPYTDPVKSEVIDPVTGLNMTVYDYPIDKDYINTIVEPLLDNNDTHLLFTAHSHLWNRFKTDRGMNVLESSNVGNSYGAFADGENRDQIPSALVEGDVYEDIKAAWDPNNYCISGDPYGLEPIEPTITKLPTGNNYITSNDITVFSVLDSDKGVVNSYYYDTKDSDGEVVLFDSFEIICR